MTWKIITLETTVSLFGTIMHCDLNTLNLMEQFELITANGYIYPFCLMGMRSTHVSTELPLHG